MIFIRHHLDEALKSEYLMVEDPLALKKALRNRYNHQTTVHRPYKAIRCILVHFGVVLGLEWISHAWSKIIHSHVNTTFIQTHPFIFTSIPPYKQTFKHSPTPCAVAKEGKESAWTCVLSTWIVGAFRLAIPPNHRSRTIPTYTYTTIVKRGITSQMKLCGDTITEEMLWEKTFNTFHASNMIMQQQYRNNELLMKNHNSRPIGSTPFLEVNAASFERNTISSRVNNYKRGCGHKRGRWNRKGKNHGVQFHNHVPRHNPGPSFKNANRQKGKAHMNIPRNSKGVCHRCGGNEHWVRTCRTPKHLVELYQASFKEKGVEINFFNQAQLMETPD
ncbi:unnamed protein product [Malus baccata var. baccata]